MKTIRRTTSHYLLTALAFVCTTEVEAGAACAVAKRFGNSLAIEWVVDAKESAAGAQRKSMQKLLAQGYRKKGQDVFSQAATATALPHVVIIETTYTTRTGRQRTSYGCGFSTRSSQDAERSAIRNLRTHSWGWRPELGYKVIFRGGQTP